MADSVALRIMEARALTAERDFDSPVLRVSNKAVANLGGRDVWVTLRANGKTIRRRARGAGARELPAETAELEYDSRLSLGITDRNQEGFYPCEIHVARTSLPGRLLAHWQHPSEEYRVPFQLSLVGFVLGVLGFVQGLLRYAATH